MHRPSGIFSAETCRSWPNEPRYEKTRSPRGAGDRWASEKWNSEACFRGLKWRNNVRTAGKVYWKKELEKVFLRNTPRTVIEIASCQVAVYGTRTNFNENQIFKGERCFMNEDAFMNEWKIYEWRSGSAGYIQTERLPLKTLRLTGEIKIVSIPRVSTIVILWPLCSCIYISPVFQVFCICSVTLILLSTTRWQYVLYLYCVTSC